MSTTTKYKLARPNKEEWEALQTMFTKPDARSVIDCLKIMNHIEVCRHPGLHADCIGGVNSALVRSGPVTGRFRILASPETQKSSFGARDLHLYEICSREEWLKRIEDKAEASTG